jgi:hypothetical protein
LSDLPSLPHHPAQRHRAFEEVTFDPLPIKPSKVFTTLAHEPEAFGRLTQLRTMHGYNRWHLIPNDSTLNTTKSVFAYTYYLHFHHDDTEIISYTIPTNMKTFSSVSSQHHDTTLLLGSTKGLLATKESGVFKFTATEPP